MILPPPLCRLWGIWFAGNPKSKVACVHKPDAIFFSFFVFSCSCHHHYTKEKKKKKKKKKNFFTVHGPPIEMDVPKKSRNEQRMDNIFASAERMIKRQKLQQEQHGSSQVVVVENPSDTQVLNQSDPYLAQLLNLRFEVTSRLQKIRGETKSLHDRTLHAKRQQDRGEQPSEKIHTGGYKMKIVTNRKYKNKSDILFPVSEFWPFLASWFMCRWNLSKDQFVSFLDTCYKMCLCNFPAIPQIKYETEMLNVDANEHKGPFALCNRMKKHSRVCVRILPEQSYTDEHLKRLKRELDRLTSDGSSAVLPESASSSSTVDLERLDQMRGRIRELKKIQAEIEAYMLQKEGILRASLQVRSLLPCDWTIREVSRREQEQKKLLRRAKDNESSSSSSSALPPHLMWHPDSNRMQDEKNAPASRPRQQQQQQQQQWPGATWPSAGPSSLSASSSSSHLPPHMQGLGPEEEEEEEPFPEDLEIEEGMDDEDEDAPDRIMGTRRQFVERKIPEQLENQIEQLIQKLFGSPPDVWYKQLAPLQSQLDSNVLAERNSRQSAGESGLTVEYEAPNQTYIAKGMFRKSKTNLNIRASTLFSILYLTMRTKLSSTADTDEKTYQQQYDPKTPWTIVRKPNSFYIHTNGKVGLEYFQRNLFEEFCHCFASFKPESLDDESKFYTWDKVMVYRD